MIVPDSPKSETNAHHNSSHSQSLLGRVDASPGPPPYSAAITAGTDYQDENRSPRPTGPRTTSSVRPNLPPRCNYFIDRKMFGVMNGSWNVDNALEIPESLLLPIPKYDGYWNREAQRTRGVREEELRRRQGQGSDSKREPPVPPVETRPNLMLATSNGTIRGDIHVLSSDGLSRQTVLVAQGFNGLIALKIHAPPEQPLRIFASTTNGSIDIKIPSSFEGAVVMSTTWGCVNLSEPVKAKLAIFSSTSNTLRGFIGGWQAQGFGTASNSTDFVEGSSASGQGDPFTSWTGPFIEIASTNGSVSLSFTEEGTITAYIDQFTKAVKGFKDSWFGEGGQGSSPAPQLPSSPSLQSGVESARSKNPAKDAGEGTLGSA